MNWHLIFTVGLRAISAIFILLGMKRGLLFLACDQVIGKVIGEELKQKDGHMVRFPTYEFEWEGKQCTQPATSPSGAPMGSSVKLRIKQDGTVLKKTNAGFLLVLGVIWLVISFIGF